jgi:hypothetical protein
VCEQEPFMVSTSVLGDELTRLQQAMDALAGAAARWTGVFVDQNGPAEAGAGSPSAWMRRELRIAGHEAFRRVRRGRTLAALPATAKALTNGEINLGHIDVLAKAATDLGSAVVAEAEPILLSAAMEADPDGLAQVTQRLRDTLDPDAADEAYVRALERRDVTVNKVGDLYQLRGVLDAVTGESLKTVLYGLSKPTSKDDIRAAGQRRVDALRTLCDERLRHGVPTDRGFRPHLFVTVTADKLTGGGKRRHEPAVLHGYGTIGDALLGQLGCDADHTEVTVDESGNVLDVGRTKRLATPKQRTAVFVQQGGSCANPGCGNTHLEVHHRVYWSRGGYTDLKDLAGYCTRCHHLIHLGLLVVESDGNGGWIHYDRRGRVLCDRRRDAEQAARDHVNSLASFIFDDDNAGDGESTVDPHRIRDELNYRRRRRRRRNRRELRRPPDEADHGP